MVGIAPPARSQSPGAALDRAALGAKARRLCPNGGGANEADGVQNATRRVVVARCVLETCLQIRPFGSPS